ncbi:MAG TPA: hypothetical protein PK304_03390 [Mobilitalea sp.]|nr:hypothetical protein [Mobilitalea sp.]
MVKRAAGNKNEDMQIYCNACGKKLKVENGILKEDAFEAVKEWGYFSEWDTQVHRFNLCEKCYKKITGEFKIPVEVKNKIEIL